LANYYYNVYHFGLSKEYCKKCIDLDDHNSTLAMNILGNILIDKGDTKGMKKYFKIAASRGNLDSTYSLASHYFNNNKYDRMKIYTQLCIDQDYNRGYNLIIRYYYNIENDYQKMFECYKKAMDKQINVDVAKLNQYFEQNNDLDNMIFFKTLLGSANLRMLITIQILPTQNRNKLDELCEVCVSENEVFETRCRHYLCKFCFARLERCPYCRKLLL